MLTDHSNLGKVVDSTPYHSHEKELVMYRKRHGDRPNHRQGGEGRWSRDRTTTRRTAERPLAEILDVLLKQIPLGAAPVITRNELYVLGRQVRSPRGSFLRAALYNNLFVFLRGDPSLIRKPEFVLALLLTRLPTAIAPPVSAAEFERLERGIGKSRLIFEIQAGLPLQAAECLAPAEMVALGCGYLPSAVIANFLSVSPREVEEAVASGELEGRTIGRRNLVLVASFRDYLIRTGRPMPLRLTSTRVT
ncbi:hypothetical protein HY628_01185 [Candidatus Uhrbacteria bacterium]|nr:hypothetical protein [Candidatus Uhrbacteria bacterium]